MKLLTLLLTFILLATASNGWPDKMSNDLEALWNMDEIRKIPFDVEVISSREDKGYRLEEIYFTSEQTPNGPNRIFCAFARPMKPKKPVPVLLMIHGGGGHADAAGALWAAQSNEAIVMYFDWSSEYIPGAANFTKWRNPFPNPYAEIARVTPNLSDSMLYHIVIGLRRGLDYISQQPDVDMTRVASFGGSWGGYLSLLLAGVDSRVGCVMSGLGAGGWRDSHSILSKPVEKLPEDQQQLWLAHYDTLAYASKTKAAVLLAAASDDAFFWLGGLQENYDALAGKKHLIITPNCDHGFGGPQMADSTMKWVKQYFTGASAFPEILADSLKFKGSTYTWSTCGALPAASAKLYFSPGNVAWPSRYWVEIPAKNDGIKWNAVLPSQFAELSGKVYVTVFASDGQAASSTTIPREGIDPQTAAVGLWNGNALWDINSGANAWRPLGYIRYQLQTTSPGAFELGPENNKTHFTALTNSVALASGRIHEFSGIKIRIDGEGKEGKLTIRLCRDTKSNKEVAYEAVIDYKADETTVDLPWSAFKCPDGRLKLPFKLDGLALDGDRPDGSTITVNAVELYK